MALYNTTSTTGVIINTITNNITGNLFLTFFVIFVFVVIIALLLNIPFEVVSIAILPLLLTLMAYNVGAFIPITIIVLVYLAFILSKIFPIR